MNEPIGSRSRLVLVNHPPCRCRAAEVTRDSDTVMVHENESIYLPIGSVHRLLNPGKIDLELIEVQTGSYLGEDDIVRIEDIYHRA